MVLHFSILLLSPVFKMGQTIVNVQIFRKVCIFNIKLCSKHKWYINTSEQTFNTYGGIPSGPLDLLGFKLFIATLYSYLFVTFIESV
jgi:hypothetical protein